MFDFIVLHHFFNSGRTTNNVIVALNIARLVSLLPVKARHEGLGRGSKVVAVAGGSTGVTVMPRRRIGLQHVHSGLAVMLLRYAVRLCHRSHGSDGSVLGWHVGRK